MHLSAEDFGAWHLLIYAMWARPSLDLPDSDRMLAQICRVSSQKWKKRIRPTMEPLFQIGGEAWHNQRLRIEASYVEKICLAQHRRRVAADETQGDFEFAPRDAFESMVLNVCKSVRHQAFDDLQMDEAKRWVSDLGLSIAQVEKEMRAVLARRHSKSPLQSIHYFTPSMQRLAGRIAEASDGKMKPITPQRRGSDKNGRSDANEIGAIADRIAGLSQP